MIALASDCLLFRMGSGESIPFSAEMISVELIGGCTERFDEDFVRQAAHAVFHYFKRELGRQTVSVGEFAEALEKVLRGLTPAAPAITESADGAAATSEGMLESDLCRLACESGEGRELFFFPRLRDELRRQLRQSPRALRFRGLRGCVKQLIGARRWNLRCRSLEEQIVEYLRECLGAEARDSQFSLLVD